MDHEVMNGQTDNVLPLIHHRRYKYNNSNSPHWFLAATKKLYEWWSLSASIPVWHTCASALSGWVLYRQLELTKLTRPDLHHVVGLFILRDVRLSIRHTFFTMFPSLYHHEIFRSYYHWLKWCPYKRSRSRSEVKVTEVKTQFSSFRTVTPIWIHIWRWNDAQSLIWHKRDALLFSKVIHQISRSHGTKNKWFGPEFGISGL